MKVDVLTRGGLIDKSRQEEQSSSTGQLFQ